MTAWRESEEWFRHHGAIAFDDRGARVATDRRRPHSNDAGLAAVQRGVSKADRVDPLTPMCFGQRTRQQAELPGQPLVVVRERGVPLALESEVSYVPPHGFLKPTPRRLPNMDG